MQVVIIVSLVAIAVANPTLLAAGPAVYTAQSPILTQYHSQDGLGQYAYGYNGDLSSKVESKSLDGVTRGSYSYIDADGRLQTVEYTADSVNGFRAAATNLPKAPIDNSIAPEPVRETPEVAQARAEHIQAYNEAAIRAAAAPESPALRIAAIPALAPAQYVAVRAAEAPAQLVQFRSDLPASFSYSTSINGQGIAAPLLQRTAVFAPQYIASPVPVYNNGEPQDTPEVAAAKALHLQAVEEQKARIAAAQ